MKDFDTDRQERHTSRERDLGDCSFKLGGKTFTYIANPSYLTLAKIAQSAEAPTIVETLELLEEGLLSLLTEGQEQEFVEVLHSTADPVTYEDLNEIVDYIVGRQTRRPLEQPSPSTSGGTQTTTSSTDGSSSEPAVGAAA